MTSAVQPPTRPFADSVLAYAQAGWPCIIPVPPVEKSPPPVGFTGDTGRDTEPLQLVQWVETHGHWSVALRMPDGVIGIDVDNYVKAGVRKHGGRSFAEAVDRWGQLPATWMSSARNREDGGIVFFRVPPGRYATKLDGGDVEIIQRHHRYAVVWPSFHPGANDGAGGVYTWYDPAGQPSDQPPKPDELPELPAAWVAGLAEGASAAGPAAASRDAGQVMLEHLVADDRPACADTVNAVMTAVDELARSDAGSRHDTAVARVHNVVMLAASGHPGLGRALPDLAALWEQLTAGEDRGEEFERMLLTSARKAVTAVGPRPGANDPCLLMGGLELGAGIALPAGGGPGPDDDRKDPDGHPAMPDPIQAPEELHPHEIIGAVPFTPREQLDQLLADAVLERMYPVLRYGWDARSWLKRQRTNWEQGAELAEWAVTQVAATMPRGNPDADKGTEERDQADKRKRLMTAAGASGVAKMMRARVAGGAHPCALKVAELDSEPWLLWAGGMAWDLTASTGGPVLAQIDPATPHLQAAGIVPELRPTPLWDAFTAAVWPDPELRAWALRVLSIAVTGYADRALPILLGERGRGKTQVVTLLMSVLGNYAHAADPRLLNGLDNAHASIIYALKGRRLSFIDEGPREGRLGQERLKQLTGGGALTGNQMNRNPITFTPTHTLVLTANDDPVLTDPAVRDRVRLIPCEGDAEGVRAARRAIGHTSSRQWRAEAPGVLAAMMREAALWLAEPNTALTAAAPAVYQQRVEEMVLEQEPVRTWVEEETEPHANGERSRALYEAFVGWSRNGAAAPARIPSETKWGKELTALGYPVIKTREGNLRGLRVKPRGLWTAPTVTAPIDPAAPVGPAAVTPDAGPQVETPAAIDEKESERPSTPSTGGDTVVSANPASVEGWWRVGGGLNAQPSTSCDPTNTGVVGTSDDLVEGVEGRITSTVTCARPHAHVPACAHEAATGEGPTPSTTLHGDVEQPRSLSRQIPDKIRFGTAFDQPTSGREVRRAANQLQHALETEQATATKRRARAERRDANRRQHEDEHVAGLRPTREEHDDELEQRKLAKAAAREQAKANARREAIAEAGGPVVALPAAVTRDGEVRPMQTGNVRQLLEAFDALAELTVDVETTGFPVGHADYALRTVQLGNDQVAVVLDRDDPEHRAVAADVLAAAGMLHAHSASADLVPLAIDGLVDIEQAWGRMHDTVLPALLADPQSTGSDADGLKDLSRDVLGDQALSPAADEARAALFKAGKWLTQTKATTAPERSGWAQADRRSTTMVRYAASDVLDAAALAKRLPPVPPALLERERTAQRMTARVAHLGVRLDAEHVDAKLPEHRAELAAAGERIRTFGIDNPGSDIQVASKLVELGAPLPTTKTGRPSVAKGAIDSLAKLDGPVGDLVRARLDYQHHETVLGLFLEPYGQLVHRGDGRARPVVYTLGADTGRMSCVRPNLQQVPRQGGIRRCITADSGEVIVSADFSSVEVRVAAALTGDPNLQGMLAAGVDLHMQTAQQAYGPAATKEDRYNTKRAVFGRLYGSGIPGIARTLGIAENEAAAIVASLDAMTPQMTQWITGLKQAVQTGMTSFDTYSGRTIHLDQRFPHKAFNYCVQGTARELLVDALMRWRDTRWGGCRLVPVHDEVIVFVPEADAAEATAALVECMQTTLHGVPIVAEASEPGFSWKDAS